MISTNVHKSLASAFKEGLSDLLHYGAHVPSVLDPLSPASGFGKRDRPTRELLGYSFQIENPRSCLFVTNSRLIRLPYCVGLFIWTMTASDDAEWLEYYNPDARTYTDDGTHLSGAFGKRLFNYRNTINQIDIICDRLRRDPSSRRTIATIDTPEDNVRETREYPCATAVQYFLRDGKLHAATFMRAQSAFGVLPFDAFLFMTLQCYVASRLGVQVGQYRHISGTYHLYEEEIDRATAVIGDTLAAVAIGEMPDPEASVRELASFEIELRHAGLARDIAKVCALASSASSCTTFFDEAKIVLLAHTLRRLGASDEINTLESRVPPPFQDLLRGYSGSAS